jgi:hypothetical protein
MWNHGSDNTGRYRGGKTVKERGESQARRGRQQERASYTRWCSDNASASASTATAASKFPWGACNGKKTAALRA